MITFPNAVEFREDKTSKITGISPDLGTTIGGTQITISGVNFYETVANTKVTIDGVNCPIDSISTTQILCTTGARPDFVPSTFIVDIAGAGHAATQGLFYTYIDRWSDSSTWNGEPPPRAGDSVFIPPG